MTYKDADHEVEHQVLNAELLLIDARARLSEVLRVARERQLPVYKWAIGHPAAAEAFEQGLNATAEMIRRMKEALHEQQPAAAPAARQHP